MKAAGLAIMAFLALAACESSEERAEEHFQSALALLEEGDVDRALVEFRNVFRLNENHTHARETYADLMLDRGNIPEAYANYLRLVETDPDNIAGREALAELAILRRDWDEAERHGAVLIDARADDINAKVIDLGLRYRKAIVAENDPLIRELTAEAESLYAEAPDSQILMRILVEGYSRDSEFEKAIAVLDTFVENNPEDEGLAELRLQVIAALNDTDRTEEALRETIAQFPENDRMKQALVQLLISEGLIDRAESYLRELVDEARQSGVDAQDRILTLITFLRQTKGIDAAIAELDAVLADTESPSVFQALKASLLFDKGQRNEAVTLMQTAIDGAEESDRTNRMKVGLARMLELTGNDTGARAMVDEVLENDAGNIGALRLRAGWLIDDDRADEAIVILRRVLDQDPEDAEAMTIMAEAHRRNGSAELALDLLSLAVEASNAGRDESLRFAAALIELERFRPAEDVLIQALRRTPDDLALLEQLGRVYLGLEDYSRATGVEEKLRRLGTPQTLQLADALRVSIIARREGREGAMAFLEGLAQGDDASLNAKLSLLRARLSGGDTEGAMELAREMLAEAPDNPALKLVLANTQLAVRDFASAETTFRDVIDQTGGNDRLWLQLVRAVSAQGRSDEGMAMVDEGLTRYQDSPALLWAKASILEQTYRIDEAITIYEGLYEKNSNSQIIANNLASLLATYRDDDESLERAWTVARRLAGTEVPAFQDTYGWIEFRRGNATEALAYLEPAAEALAGDPIVQFHLARALEEVGRTQDAAAAYARAVEVADDTDERPQITDARAAIERLKGEGGE